DAGEGPGAEQPHGQHGVPGAGAVEDEADEQRRAGEQAGQDGGAGPAVGGPADQAVDDAEQSAAGEQGAGDVERGPGAVGLREAQTGERDEGEAQRNVQPEDPLPRDVLGEAAADQGSGGHGESVDGAPDAVGGPAPRLGHGGGEQGQRQGHHDRRAGALDRAGGDEGVDAGGEGRGRGRRGEDGEAGDEEAPTAEAVTEGGAEHQQHGEGERVGAHGPFEVVQCAAQVLSDGGQRGGDDEVVQGRHEAGDAGDDEGPGGSPATFGVR